MISPIDYSSAKPNQSIRRAVFDLTDYDQHANFDIASDVLFIRVSSGQLPVYLGFGQFVNKNLWEISGKDWTACAGQYSGWIYSPAPCSVLIEMMTG